MAVIKCSVTNSKAFEMYIEYSVVQNAETCVSTVAHALKLKQLTDAGDFNGNMNVTYRIGNESFTYNGNFNIDDKGNAGSVFTIKSGTTEIKHDKSTGEGKFYVSCSGSCNSGGYGPGTISLTGYYQSLPILVSNSVLNSVTVLTVNSATPMITLNWTIYSNYTHTLDIKDGNVVVLSITGLRGSVGTNNINISLTSAQRQTLLKHMSNKAYFTATYCLTSFKDSSQVGAVSVKTAKIQLAADAFAPVFTDFSHKDSNITTTNITGGNQIYIKGYSQLHISVVEAIAKDNAHIDSYRVTVGTETKSFTSTDIDFGVINAADNALLTVEAVDSRGFSTAVNKRIQVIDYNNISITSYSVRRRNEVESTVKLSFSGSFSPIEMVNGAKNKIIAEFRYAPNGGTWSDWDSLDEAVVENDESTFTFTTTALTSSDGTTVDFDAALQYTIEIRVWDILSSDRMTLVVNKGTPLVSFRSKKVGINTPNPQGALDVRNGNILMNGYVVQGFVAELGDTEHLDDLKSSGVWTQAVSANASVDRGYPINEAGWLEVFENPQGGVMQRYTTCDCSRIFLRFYGEQWSEWKSTLFT